MSTIQQILSQATGGLNAGQTVVANASRNMRPFCSSSVSRERCIQSQPPQVCAAGHGGSTRPGPGASNAKRVARR